MDIMKVLFDQDEVTRSLLASKYKEGMKEGRDEGRNEAKADVIRNGRSAGLSIDMLARLTGMSEEEIDRILS